MAPTAATSVSATDAASSANSNTGTNPPRRGSQGGTLFSGLMNQKRGSGDAAANARRESFADQKPQAGVIGKMWHNFTTGGSPENK